MRPEVPFRDADVARPRTRHPAELHARLSALHERSRPSGSDPADCRNVTIIMVMSEVTLPLAEIKKRLSEIVDGVELRHDRVLLTRNGRPAAVIMSPDDLEALEETLEILSDPKAMREIRQAERAIEKGNVVTGDELRAKYLKG